jgi:uroporphyrinogen-III synthase
MDPRIFDVVVTRDASRCRELATQVAAHGARVVALPLTRTAPPTPDERAALVAAAGGADGFDAVVVASANAAEALAAALRAAGARLDRARVVAVGEASAGPLRPAMTPRQPELPARADAIGVADHLLAAAPDRPRRVLWPRAADGREDGIERLRAAGVEVVAPVAYRTEPTPPDDPALAEGLALVARGAAAVVALYAPSQVAALAALLAPHGGLAALAPARVVAIGETTAAALRGHGVAVAAIAATPDAAGMASAIAAVYPGSR